MQHHFKRFFLCLILGMSFASNSAIADHATLSLDPSPACYDLLAGQYIDSGDVCVTTDGTNLTVTYTTQDGWELNEAHLWIGDSIDGFPQTKKGNPQVGKFPNNSGDITGVTVYSFTMSLSSVTDLFDGDLHNYCGSAAPSLYMMAHAAVQKPDANGGYQTETGWSDGDNVVDRGSWATRSTLNFRVDCESIEPPPPSTNTSETAWMFGNEQFNEMLGCGVDGIRGTADDAGMLATRWGWSEGPLEVGESITQPFWAAAGLNDTSKGTHVGDVTVTNNGGMVEVSVYIFPPFVMAEDHIYVGSTQSCTVAPGLLGNTTSTITTNPHVSYITHDNTPAYVAVHGVVKGPY
jgi:hypothetical protein